MSLNSTLRSGSDLAVLTTLPSAVSDDEVRRQRNLWLALGVLGAALFAQEFVTLSKVKRVLLERAPGEPVNSLARKAWGLLADSWSQLATPADLTIAALILFSAGYIVWTEARRGTLTALLHRAETDTRVLFGFLALATVVVTRCYLAPGQVFMGDSETHMLRSWMFVEHFRNLDVPVWSNAWYGGFPLLEHYGSLYFIATALLTVVTGDIHVATKLLLWSCHVVSVAAMFVFLREVTGRPLAALVGAFAYAISFLRLHILLYQGDLQLSIVFALYPVILLLIEQYLRGTRRARPTFILVTFAFAALILNHHGYAFFGLVLIAVYLIGRLAVTEAPLRDRFRILVMFGCAEIASLVVTSFLLVPFLFGMAEHRGMGSSAFPMVIPNPLGPLMLVKLFRWSALGDGSSLGYIGLSIGLLAAIGALHAVRHRGPAAVGLAACALASLLMVRNRVSYNVKNVDFFLIFVCALAAWAVVFLADNTPRLAVLVRGRTRWADRFPARVATLCIGLMVLDLGPTTFQSVFRENYEFKQPMYGRLSALGGPYKVVERQVLTYDAHQPPGASFDPNKLGIPSAYAPIQTPLGFFHEGAGRSFGYNIEIVKNLQRDLNDGRVSDLSTAGLYLLGVKYVLFRDRYRWFTPDLPPSSAYTVRDGVLQLTNATPLIVSRRVIASSDIAGYPATDLIRDGRYLEPETFDYSGRYFRQLVAPVIQTMHVDTAHGVADALVSRDGDLRRDAGTGGALQTDILQFSTDLKRVAVRYRLNADAVGELPYNYFPYLRVDVDERAVPFYRSAMNAILLELPAGEHVVSVRGVMPPLQAQCLWVSLAAALLVVVLPRRVFSSVDRTAA